MPRTYEKLDRQKRELLSGLYALYEQKLYRVAFSILRNAAQAEDAVQEAFLKVIPYLSCVGKPEDEKTRCMMVNAVRQTAIDQYRKNKRVTFSPEEEAEKSSEAVEMLPADSAENREYIRQILSEMSEQDREIIRFRCFYELSYCEISAVLEISEEAAKKRFQRARDAFRKKTGGAGYEG